MTFFLSVSFTTVALFCDLWKPTGESHVSGLGGDLTFQATQNMKELMFGLANNLSKESLLGK